MLHFFAHEGRFAVAQKNLAKLKEKLQATPRKNMGIRL